MLGASYYLWKSAASPPGVAPLSEGLRKAQQTVLEVFSFGKELCATKNSFTDRAEAPVCHFSRPWRANAAFSLSQPYQEVLGTEPGIFSMQSRCASDPPVLL